MFRYAEFYRDVGIEIIVVDDGSGDNIDGSGVKIIKLPRKDHALNPCVPYNIGVSYASGDYIVLTNPEVIPRTAFLERMRDECGPNDYVAAACWSDKHNTWFCHSSGDDKKLGRAKLPRGAGLHFCAMIRKEFYQYIGGFDEQYRWGQGFDDNDLLWKLHAAHANFKILDDCVTDHIECPPSQWPAGGHARNKKIFESKWP